MVHPLALAVERGEFEQGVLVCCSYIDCIGFDWDEGNSDKNWILHQVSKNECEQVFFNAPIIVGDDKFHSQSELRWFLLGKTDNKRQLFIVFSIRDKLIRVISARNMSKKASKIPVFKNEEEERAFWSENDSSEYVDWDASEKVAFSNLKPTTKTISLRLPEFIIDELKVLAHKKDVPYQSLIKIFLKDRIDQELRQAL